MSGGLQLESSSSSQTSETSTPRAGSPFNPSALDRCGFPLLFLVLLKCPLIQRCSLFGDKKSTEPNYSEVSIYTAPHRGLNDSSDSAHFLSPPPTTTPVSATPTSRRSPGVGVTAPPTEHDPLSVAMEPGNLFSPFAYIFSRHAIIILPHSPFLEEIFKSYPKEYYSPLSLSLSLLAGDFFITRHSNLSQVHLVLHLSTDREAVRDPGPVPIPVPSTGVCVCGWLYVQVCGQGTQ